MLYGELLAMPGVLAQQHGHYAQELQGIAKSTAQIIEQIVACSAAAYPAKTISAKSRPSLQAPAASFVPLPVVPVTDASEELRHLQPLLAAIAGPAIRLSIGTMPCAGRTALAVEDLTRVLVNLVRNAADAMPAGGHIRITAQYGNGLSFLDAADFARAAEFMPGSIVITVADNGPGIPESLREQVFETGFSTRTRTEQNTGHWPAPRRRGLGLSIVRNIVEAAGGTVCVASAPARGARFEIHLPIALVPLLTERVPNPESHVSC
jgi:signal transduction histidine kinase